MPFQETDRVEQREELIRAWVSGSYSKSELAWRFGVSRPTVDLWIERSMSGEALSDRSRAPKNSPYRTDAVLVERIVAFRQAHRFWGPKKIADILRSQEPNVHWPAPSTIGEILTKRGLTTIRPRYRHNQRSDGSRPTRPSRAGEQTTADFKGQFRLGNRQLCYPLTIADPVSRYIYAVEALHATSTDSVQMVFERVFREHGLPDRILTDNGSPFCAVPSLGKLSRLAVWWLKLGVDVEQTRPGRPGDNAVHERMHKTLKAHTTRPPERTMLAQQRRFDQFREEFNHLRPHDGLQRRCPAAVHRSSLRPFPERTPEVSYPGHFEIRRVQRSGQFSWKTRVFVSHALAGELIGLEQIDDDLWNVYFAHKLLGRCRVGDPRIV